MSTILKNTVLLIALWSCTATHSQNILSNGDFESFTEYPFNFGQFDKAIGWTNCQGQGSPDYFHKKGKNGVKLPDTEFATVSPHSGDGVMGLTTWTDNISNFREYISHPLDTFMIPGKTYKVKFFVTSGQFIGLGGYGANRMGVSFTESEMKQDSFLCFKFIEPTYFHAQVIYTSNWVEISFNFVPTRSFKFITIGNNYDDMITEEKLVDFSSQAFAYYFIDDISVELVKDSTSAISNNSQSIDIYPNPFCDKIYLDGLTNEMVELKLFDLHGTEVFSATIQQERAVNIKNLPI